MRIASLITPGLIATLSPPLHLKFVMSAPSVDALIDSGPEIAVVGRSNVGKSSLLNALANHKGLAMVSKTPGRTRLLNLFELPDGSGAVIDLPGYGSAAVSAKLRNSWQEMIENYLLEREQLMMVLVLVDGLIGPTKLDTQMLDWLQAHELPYAIVATKHDKVKPSQRDRRRRELAEGCEVAQDHVLWVSAAKNVGLDKLRSSMRHWLSDY